MNLKLIEAQAKALAPVFQNMLSAALKKQREELESKFNAQIEEVKNSIPDISGLTREFEAIKAIELPEIPDISATFEEFTESVNKTLGSYNEFLLKSIEKFPIPKDGADGKSVTLEDVQPLIDDAVAKAVGEIPKPVDGKSVTVDEVVPILSELVTEAVAQIPAPQDGKSVTVDDVLPAIEAKIAEKIAEIPPANDGKDGIDGKSVAVEDVLPLITEEIAKQVAQLPPPKDGKDGADGKDGLNGKDALQIEIQPSVDFDKSYPRGTYAIHNGGLIKSYMQTNGRTGWETVFNGIASFDFHQINDRTVQVSMMLTNGEEKKATFNVPAVIDRGVFREENKYLSGDGVTFGGSYWIALKNDPQGKPGTSDDWRLAVKKGRDGKDAK